MGLGSAFKRGRLQTLAKKGMGSMGSMGNHPGHRQTLAEKGLADGSVSAKAFAVIAQPTINQYCVACHRVAAPEAGKPFALTDIAALTPEQRIKVIEVIMTDDEAAMMPKAGSAQRKQWNAEAAAAAMREVTKAKPYQAEGPGTLSAPKP